MTAGLPRSRKWRDARTPLTSGNSSSPSGGRFTYRSGEDSMTPTPKSASGATARQDAAEQAKPQGAAGPFVLNLTSSTTPMALANPEQPELKRFSFFVSRRFEEGRERFRLHMGYFSTLAEAEEWLGAVRDIYPGAWAGEAPGKKLRERAVAAAAAQAQHAAGPPPLTATARAKALVVPPQVPTLPVAQAASIDVPDFNVPTIHAANASAPAAAAPRNVPVAKPAAVPFQAAPVARVVPPAPAAPRAPVTVTPASAPSVIGMMRAPKAAAPAPKAVPVVPVAAQRSTAPVQPRSAAPLPMAAPRAPAAVTRPVSAIPTHSSAPAAARPAAAANTVRATAQPAKPTAPAAMPPQAVQPVKPVQAAKPIQAAKPALPNSNVREVLKALEETSSEAEITGETRMMPAPMLAGLTNVVAESDDANFSDTQVLKFLESRRADGTELSGVEIETGAISLLKPDDTGTRRALKEAVTSNAPVWFAVQLQWSVQPVELSKVPPLAIFSAYTLYTVEGSRDGRKWYGLRLGFFSDAISAKQVAYYVRSEFTSVAVVPVSPQEKTRASDVDKKAEMSFPKKARSGPVDEFKLIDSDDTASPPARARQSAAVKPVVPARTAPPAAAANRRPPNKAANGRVRARDPRAPQTLEETLEILGAGELEMDNGNGETMNESGVRHLRVEVQKNTPFGRLLERLSERVRKP